MRELVSVQPCVIRYRIAGDDVVILRGPSQLTPSDESLSCRRGCQARQKMPIVLTKTSGPTVIRGMPAQAEITRSH